MGTKAPLADSGGAGERRGGLGQRLEVRKLFDDDLPVQLAVMAYNLIEEAPGLAGGHAGSQSHLTLEDGEAVTSGWDLGTLIELRRPQQHVTIELPGGSGYGDPRERPLTAIQADYDQGYLSRGGLADYGCDVDTEGRVFRLDDGA